MNDFKTKEIESRNGEEVLHRNHPTEKGSVKNSKDYLKTEEGTLTRKVLKPKINLAKHTRQEFQWNTLEWVKWTSKGA